VSILPLVVRKLVTFQTDSAKNISLIVMTEIFARMIIAMEETAPILSTTAIYQIPATLRFAVFKMEVVSTVQSFAMTIIRAQTTSAET